ncbi:GH36-type glycosyl hydrolase domain-containing protein [Shewanella sp. UCD-KL12]|uniref:GH36-type glycosyl hydrolase domain-containing protein n=1 Tax=Shewanella sp. UCD-KL12 TaxID=1917163 RepID=UPI000970531F|nr:NdvB protein [Shewanella sp. UCD-KL12]
MNNQAPFSCVDHALYLHDPKSMPKASGFLWNPSMMLQMNCRGYATAQFMQPEPAKYAHGPALEAKTFMQPEHSFYAHHPARFFYIKDEDSKKLFSAPFEPVRQDANQYQFTVQADKIKWLINFDDIEIEITLNLSATDIVEMWLVTLKNEAAKPRNISFYPYFTIGNMSWMNQGADFDTDLNAIVASSVTPYQKVSDYPRQKGFKDLTFLLADRVPCAWTSHQASFEGEGGLHNPDNIAAQYLSQEASLYEAPIAVYQYRLTLDKQQTERFKFVFGPAKDKTEIAKIKQTYLDTQGGFEQQQVAYKAYIANYKACMHIETPEPLFNQVFNLWLPRQMYYHGDVNRLSTDPQTRNYLQDNMGMSYIAPERSRSAFLKALSQQQVSGAMPDGILLSADAELKYINQIPHTDHCVWLPICILAYLNETGDLSLLKEKLPYADAPQSESVFLHVSKALNWLVEHRDSRGLSYINQGDWCDPMNMVGYKGKGVSSWLSLATAYALNQWAELAHQLGHHQIVDDYLTQAAEINQAVNQHCWDGHWFARGITDDNRLFGVQAESEGRIYLNPQSWAMMSGAADEVQQASLCRAIDEQLMTPFGPMMLAPSYTQMQTDIGRLTQKFPGTAENGSVYNHASVFYAWSLCKLGKHQQAFELLVQMLPNFQDAIYRGQLPNFIPNYYRGAYHQYPKTAGRSSQLFNTGTLAWYYRCFVEEIIGIKGDLNGLIINPHLPKQWPSISLERKFRGAIFHISIKQVPLTAGSPTTPLITVNGKLISGNRIDNFKAGEQYTVTVDVPTNLTMTQSKAT